MKKLIVSSFVSLDGVIESPWEWVGSYFDVENMAYSLEKLAEVDTFFLGRKTYEKFAATWSAIQGNPYFDKINGLPKVVASKTLKDATWNARIIEGEVTEEIARLKKESGKNILKYGIGPLDHVLFRHGLIDEFQLGIVPKTVGKGLRLFGDFDPTELQLVLSDTKVLSNGVIYLTYLPEKPGGTKPEL
jgi:dihydrofolate reductase